MIVFLNRQIQDMYNVTENDYLKWCEENHKSKSKKHTVSEFVWRLRTGRLVKDEEHNKFIKKKPRRK